MFPYHPIFSLLQQEGYLTRSCLYTGFAALATANIDDQHKGNFYVAFFQLSIGLERLMKLTLILDFMASNDLKLPDNKWLKAFSHNLADLLESIRNIEKRVSKHNLIDKVLKPYSLEKEILHFFDEFSQKTRYANLDSLTGRQNIVDPLARWSRIAHKIFEKDIPVRVKQRIDLEAAKYGLFMNSFSVVMASDLEKNPISFEEGFQLSRMFQVVAPLAIWRIMKIVYPIYKTLDEVSGLARGVNVSLHREEMIVPVMYEFFIDFVSNDKNAVLNIEQWLQNA
jgi:hypothetical protein